jgi:ABC-type branched-subunit amino acid transport system permease subunit
MQTLSKGSWLTQRWWLFALIILLCAAPVGLSEFYLTVLCEALVMSMLALSFNLLFGYMGQLSFGQAAFYGLGGYAVALLMTKAHFNFWLSLVAGVVLAAMVGAIVGYFCVRLRGIYFAVLTLAFGQLLFYRVQMAQLHGRGRRDTGCFPSRVPEVAGHLLLLPSGGFSRFELWPVATGELPLRADCERHA